MKAMNTDLERLTAALVDRYAIERQIGAGGMATVYLANDIRHRRRVAVKLLNPELGAVLGADRFLSEIRVTANLQHPNLLPLFDSGEANGLLFYVMPYIEGETLRGRLDREKQLPIDEAVRITTAIAGALDYAHRHGVVHRDLKPENILLHDGQPLIADFGIALAVSNAGGERVTQTGLSLGTPQYMSPEQATGDRGVDGRTDIYSLGAVAYEMIGGEPPHHGTTAQAIIAKLMTEEARPLATLRKSVPPHVAGAIQRALEKLPADRWASAREFSEALNDHRASYQASSAHAAKSGATRGPWLPWAIAAAAVLIAAGVSLMRRSAPDPQPYLRIPIAQAARDGAGMRAFAFAPDGMSFAYVARSLADSVPRIHVRRLDDLHARVFAGTDGVVTTEEAAALAFSPDGEWIAFQTAGAVRKLRISSGAVTHMMTLDFLPYGLSWGADTAIIVSTGGRLVSLPANGGSPRPIATRDSTTFSRRNPLALPDGDHIVFGSVGGGGAIAELGILSARTGKVVMLPIRATRPVAMLDGQLLYLGMTKKLEAVPLDVDAGKVSGEPVPVLSDVQPGEDVDVAISRKGALVYSVSSHPREIIELRKSGMRPLGLDSSAYGDVRRSPDGRRIASASEGAGKDHIWIGRVGSTSLERLTDEGSNTRPEWTPDSREVLFLSNRGGTSAIWIQRADGGAPAKKLLQIPGVAVWEGQVTPDGKTLIYRTGSQASADIWYRSLLGDTTAKPIATSRYEEASPRISPDGKWLAYNSTEPGIAEVYVIAFPSLAERMQITHGGGSEPVWAGNSRLFYTINQRAIASAALSMGPEVTVTRFDTLPGQDLYFGSGHPSYDALPDGSGVLAIRYTPTSGDVVFVSGFRDHLRRLVKR
jgi:Tol biopolymer transport system component/tRNA A-37 threonylcarbamoyl transferase component Bud32